MAILLESKFTVIQQYLLARHRDEQQRASALGFKATDNFGIVNQRLATGKAEISQSTVR